MLRKIVFYCLLLSTFSPLMGQKKPLQLKVSRVVSPVVYRNCENVLSLHLPNTCQTTTLRCQAVQRARIERKPHEKNVFLITPQEKELMLQISDSTDIKGMITCRVIEPPTPDIRLKVTRSRADTNQPKSATTIEAKLTIDAEFQVTFPNDANYVIESVSLYQISHFYPLIQRFDTQKYNPKEGIVLTLDASRLTHPGGYLIEIGKVYRVNYLGEKIEEAKIKYEHTTYFFD